jgi:predicted enzyme related to lactoylglutathione lyase
MFAETVDELDEVFVHVKDLPRMRGFYEDVLGFEEEFHDEDWGVGLRTQGASLILVKSEQGSSGVSLVFACSDIDRSLQSVVDQGVTITRPVEDGHWGAKIAGFEDPEGNTIYLEQPAQ